jgi:FMN phosphatase YigB (HAD superfamily)
VFIIFDLDDTLLGHTTAYRAAVAQLRLETGHDWFEALTLATRSQNGDAYRVSASHEGTNSTERARRLCGRTYEGSRARA